MPPSALAARARPTSVPSPRRVATRLPPGLRARRVGWRAAGVRPRLARDQAHLLEGDRAARRGGLRGDRARPPRLRRQRRGARRLPRRRLARPRPLRAGARPARSRARRPARRRPRWPGHPGPRAPPPRLGRPHGAVQLAAALRQGAHERDAHQAGSGGQRLLRAPGHRRRRAGRRAARRPSERRRYIATFYTSRFWAHPGAFVDPPTPSGRPGSAARRPSTSTPSRSATAPSCERRSAATRARSTRRHASSRLASGATSGPGR